MIHKDGHEVWVRDTGKVIERDEKGPITMIGTHIDITDLKLREEKLRVVIEAIEASLAGIIVTDSQAIIKFANARFLEITGYNNSQVLNQDVRKHSF